MKTTLKIAGCILIISFQLSIKLYAQGEPRWRWARTGTEATVDLSVSDTLGNTYVFGEYSTLEFAIGLARTTGMISGKSNNLYLAKFSSTGSILWLKSIAGLDANTILKPVKLAVNERGDVSILGSTSNTSGVKIDNTVMNFSNTNEQMFVAKFHKAGRILWARIVQLRGNPGAFISGNDIVMNNAGELFVTGHFLADTAQFNLKIIPGHPTDPIFFLAKYNSLGFIDWVQTCDYDKNGDNGMISGQKIVLDNAGNIVIAGQYSGYRSFYLLSDTLYSMGGTDLFIASYSGDGTARWVKEIRGNLDENAEQLLSSSGDALFISGTFNSTNIQVVDQNVVNTSAAYDLFVAKLTIEGDCKWAVDIDLKLLSLSIPGHKVAMSADENSDMYLTALFQGAEVLTNAFKQVNAQEGSPDLLFLKLDGETGAPIWSKSAAGAGDNWLNSVSYDRFNDLYFVTNINGNNLLSSSVLIKDTIGYGGNYIAKINNAGVIGFVKPILNRDTSSLMNIKSLSTDYFGNLYVSGVFTGANMNLDNLPFGAANTGMFTAKYSYVTDISGHVKKSDDSPITEGYVKVYGFTRFQRAPVSDSVDINPDGSYLFSNIPLGRYIIYAKAKKLSYPYASPTYYPNASYWEDALPILINTTNPIRDIDIIINMPSPITGTNLLGGNISETDTLVFSKSTFSITKAPSKAVSIVLINRKKVKSTLDDVVAVVYTDENGDFIINDVPDGWYSVLVDVPGLPHSDYYDIYVSGGQYIGNLYYELGLEEIYPVNKITSVQNIEDLEFHLTFYPNPCKNFFKIILNDQAAITEIMTVEIFNITGQLVQTIRIDKPEETNIIDINQLNSGVYMIRTEYAGMNYFEKIIKLSGN